MEVKVVVEKVVVNMEKDYVEENEVEMGEKEVIMEKEVN